MSRSTSTLREVVQLRGVEETVQRDDSPLTLDTTSGSITLNIVGLNAPMHIIIEQAQAVALASRACGST